MDIKKLFIFMLISILLVGTVSAFEFDNVKSYDDAKREYTITNSFGLGEDLAKVKLTSSLNEIVPIGYQQVAELQINSYDDYVNVFNNMQFYDLNDGEKSIERNFDYMIKTIVQEPKYTYQCSKEFIDNNDLLKGHKDCVRVQDGTKDKIVWIKINKVKGLLKGDITIGIFTNVQEGDVVEWIPTLYGERLTRFAVWTQDLNADYISDYPMNDNLADTVVIDSLANNTGILRGGDNTEDKSVAGKLGTALNMNGDDDAINTTVIMPTTNFTVVVWVNLDNFDVDYGLINTLGSGAQDGVIVLADSDPAGELKMYTFLGGSASINGVAGNTTLSGSVWEMVTLTYNGDLGILELFLNDTFIGAGDGDPILDHDIPLEFGEFLMSNYADGSFDQGMVWGRVLNFSSIQQLWNNGVGMGWALLDNPPTVSDIYPVNTTNFTVISVTSNATVSDNVNVTKVEFYVNGVLNQTNQSQGVYNNSVFTFDVVINDGTHTLQFNATDNNSASTLGNLIYVNINTTPNIQIVAPTEVNEYNTTTTYIPFGVTISETYFNNLTFLLFNTTGLVEEFVVTNNTRFVNWTGLPDDKYTYNATVWTTTSQTNSSRSRNLTIDTTFPTQTFDNPNADTVTPSVPINLNLNVTVVDDNLDLCLWSNDTYVTNYTYACNNNQTMGFGEGGEYTIYNCANDTFGHQTCGSISYEIFYYTYSQSVNPTSIGEGGLVDFTLFVNQTDIPDTSAILMVNSINYSGATLTEYQNYTRFDKSVAIPTGWGNTTGLNVTGNWYYNISTIVKNVTSDFDITVFEMAIDNCTDYGTLILNFSLMDEEANELVSEVAGTNVEVDVTITSIANTSLSLSFADTWTDDYNPQVCVPIGLLNNSNYTMDFTVGFDSVDRVWEFYYLDAGILNSTLVYDAYTEMEISLMDLNSSDSTSFLFNYFNEDGLSVEGSMVHVFRNYIGEGVFREVERAKADDNGDTIVHLVEEDVIYYFVITLNGETLFTSNEYTALCQDTPCTIRLEASGEFADFSTDYDLVSGGGFLISSNAISRVINLTYALNHTADINFTLYRYESDGSFTIVNSSEETGSIGVIELTAPLVAGNVSFFASIQKDDVFISSEWIDFESDASQFFGSTLALFLAGLIILTLGLVAVSEGAGTIIFVILGILFSGALGLLYTQLSTGVNVVVYMILVGALIIWKLSRRKN